VKKSATKILFLNQTVGPLFRELAEDVAKACGPSLLYTGYRHTVLRKGSHNLKIKAGPMYDRRSNLKRLFSWLNYFIRSFFVTAKESRHALLFIVSNPPFLGLVGLFYKLLRKQRYAVLVYDVYPDILVALGVLKEGLVPRAWRFLNRFILERASLVFTISGDMARVLEKSYDLRRTAAAKALVIPNWADVEIIKPVAKEDNWFAVQQEQVGKTTVLYSGNMGNTHDIESILHVARKLREHEGVHFLLIGGGAKWTLVERTIRDEKLTNITLLPFQPEEVLPYSMTTGDIGIVAYQPGTEGCIVPSKTFYYMAAGLIPLIICTRETDLSEMAAEYRCGLVVRNGDVEGMTQAILDLEKDPTLLVTYKQSARSTAERYFSRGNTTLFVQAIQTYLGGSSGNF
jgi:glycosyltransferase involved in cell wall biosynthesis